MPRILAIHAGKTKTYTTQGVPFETAICKDALQGLVTITHAGVEGNEVANHKNAIYAFCAENYAYWNATLTPNPQWAYGTVGENLTLQGIDEAQVRIGDLFQIGAVTLQVSGCRAPCVNFLWRVNLPTSFLRTYQESGRTGFYLEVLQTGVIQAGDEVRHIPCTHDSITVPDLARFFLDPQPNAHDLDRLLAIPGMGAQMLSSLTASRNAIIEKALVQTNRWNGWRAFQVSQIVQEAQGIKSFYLRPTDGAGVAGYRAGQFVSVRVPNPGAQDLVRCWSLSSYEETLQHYRISIKREAEGAASRIMHDHIQVGDVLDLLPPSGHFTLDRSSVAQPVVLISAGVGITPMLSMFQSHLKRLDTNLPTLYFIHTTQNKATHAFREEVNALVAQRPQFFKHTVYTRPDAQSVMGQDYDASERLNARMLNDVFKDMGCWFSEKWIAVAPNECKYYLCGPDAFMNDVRAILVEQLKVPDKSIYQESFAAGVGALDDVQLPAAQVRFEESALSASWCQDDDVTLLELAEKTGLRPDFSCRNGQCGLCRTSLLQGEVFYARAPSIALASNEVLLCCSLPKGDVVLAM